MLVAVRAIDAFELFLLARVRVRVDGGLQRLRVEAHGAASACFVAREVRRALLRMNVAKAKSRLSPNASLAASVWTLWYSVALTD